MIPLFNRDGNLPPGIHTATMTEIKRRFAHTDCRRALTRGLELLVYDLKASGCRTLYLDGSFICNVPKPRDYDACWETEDVRNTIPPILREIGAFRIERKHKYGGDIFYRCPETGIDYLEFFQKTRDGKAKGIIRINLRTV